MLCAYWNMKAKKQFSIASLSHIFLAFLNFPVEKTNLLPLQTMLLKFWKTYPIFYMNSVNVTVPAFP